jgi:uncharacterized protein (DUF58 family)
MGGLTSSIVAMWAWLTLSTSAMYLATVTLLAIFLALHVLAVQIVVRPFTRTADTSRTRSGERRTHATSGRKPRPFGPTVVAVQVTTSPGHAPHPAVEAVELQLAQRATGQRREETYAVPSRRRSA